MTTCRFLIPGALCARLAALHLAADQEMVRTPLAHIALTLRGDQLRFAATDGKILALLRTDVLERSGADSLDLILDATQFTEAAKAQAKVKPQVLTVLIDTEVKEMRLGSQHSAGLVTLRDGAFPRVDGVMTKYAGGTWWPSLATFDQRYLCLLPKLTGKPSPLLRSATFDGPAVAPIWPSVRPSTTQGNQPPSIPAAAVSRLVCAPGWYCDPDLLVLVMPINRTEEGGEVSFDRFLLTSAPAAATATSTATTHAAAA